MWYFLWILYTVCTVLNFVVSILPQSSSVTSLVFGQLSDCPDDCPSASEGGLMDIDHNEPYEFTRNWFHNHNETKQNKIPILVRRHLYIEMVPWYLFYGMYYIHGQTQWNWEHKTHSPHTVKCRYNSVWFTTILHKTLWWQWQKVNQILESKQTPHISPLRGASYGVSIVRIGGKTDVITARHCMHKSMYITSLVGKLIINFVK